MSERSSLPAPLIPLVGYLAVTIPAAAILLGVFFLLAIDAAVAHEPKISDWRTISAPRPDVACWEKGFGSSYAVVCLPIEASCP